jgi:hypothetical protein
MTFWRSAPFRAYFQPGAPVYAPFQVQLWFGTQKKLVGFQDHSQALHQMMHVAYRSPIFEVKNSSELQRFCLPRPVILTREDLSTPFVLAVRLIGKYTKQEYDDMYYVCICFVRCIGKAVNNNNINQPVQWRLNPEMKSYDSPPPVESIFETEWAIGAKGNEFS